LDAINDLNRVLVMLLSGTTPEEEAAKAEKQLQEEQLKEEASRMEVMGVSHGTPQQPQ